VNWTEQDIQVRISKTRKAPRRAFVSEDGLFAVYETVWPFDVKTWWTVAHVPSGYCLSEGHSNRRNAELFVAIWRALPLPWHRRDNSKTFQLAYQKMPAKLREWVKAVRPQRETQP